MSNFWGSDHLVDTICSLTSGSSWANEPLIQSSSKTKECLQPGASAASVAMSHGIAQRLLVPEGSAIAKALDYSLKRWIALTRYLYDGAVPIDNNWCENQIRPWALGRSNWLFAGSLRSGKRAAAIMSLIQSARLNGHDPYA